MKKLVVGVSLVVAAVAFAGCKKKDAAGAGAQPAAAGKSVGSCDKRAETVGIPGCTDHTGSFWASNAKEAQARCVAPGKWSAEPCPAAGVVVSCKTMPGQPMEAIQRFYDKADKAKAMCTSVGGQLL